MSLNNPAMHEGFVPAYQVSAVPYLTSSSVTLGQTQQFEFGYATRFFTIKNNSVSTAVIAFSFTSLGLTPSNSNYYILSGAQEYSGEIRTDRLFVSGVAGSATFSIVAGLTGIPSRNMLQVTGSNGFNGVG